jgi:hypothetical protein
VFKKILYNDEQRIRPGFVIGLFVLAIGAGGYYVYARWQGAEKMVGVRMMCVTPGCGYVRERQLEVGESIPGTCPQCGKASVYTSLRCRKCETPNVLNEDRGLKGPTRCTKCGTELRYGG